MIKNETPYGAMIDRIVARLPVGSNFPLHLITVKMSHTLRTTGGISSFLAGQATVTLNAAIFSHISDSEKYEVISHELAHALLQVSGHPREQHGLRWEHLHRLLGGTGKRTHSFKTVRNVVRRAVLKDKQTGNAIALSLNKWHKIAHKIAQIPQVEYFGIVAADQNTGTYWWEKTSRVCDKHIPVFKNLVLAS